MFLMQCLVAKLHNLEKSVREYIKSHPFMVGHSYCDVHAYYDRGVHTVVSIYGWSWRVTATVTSMHTMTEGCTQWCPSTDGHGGSQLL